MKNKYITQIFLLLFFLLFITCKKENTPPVARYTVDPLSGNTETIFIFDASSSYDTEDDLSQLLIRWDWNNDAIWDTDFSSLKIAQYQFSNHGSHVVNLEIIDLGGLKSNYEANIIVSRANHSPEIPSNPYPEDNSTNIDLRIKLGWQCSDPDDDSLTYKLYFGNTEDPPLLISEIKNQYYLIGELDQDVKYFWKIIAKDINGFTTDSPVWQFTTTSGRFAETGIFTDPRDDSSYKTVRIGTQWWFSENLNFQIPNGSTCYDGSSSNCKLYGRLYNWETANIACPTGWHLPTDEEWKLLELNLGMSKDELSKEGNRSSGSVGFKLKSVSGWEYNRNGNNYSGFNSIPGGYQGLSTETYLNLGKSANFWTQTLQQDQVVWARYILSGYTGVFRSKENISKSQSVRCIKN